MKIYPSLISADLLNLASVLNMLDPHCDGYHLDVMDNHFVPNLTWGPDFINRIRQTTSKQLDIHLMVDNPHTWLSRLKLNANDMITFHIEALQKSEAIEHLVSSIHTEKLHAGIALNPATPVEKVYPHLMDLDHVLLMSVNPGFSGQTFIPDVISKIKPLVTQRSISQKHFSIGMDGGIGSTNIATLAEHGVDYACAASAIFAASNPIQALSNLYHATK